jgi:hypothetical protein
MAGTAGSGGVSTAPGAAAGVVWQAVHSTSKMNTNIEHPTFNIKHRIFNKE